MANQQHNNPWAEKLLQVSMPDSGEAWTAMEVLLDREMPGGWKRDGRRWVLLILLLLLLIGVCNCPGRLFHRAGAPKVDRVRQVDAGKIGGGGRARSGDSGRGGHGATGGRMGTGNSDQGGHRGFAGGKGDRLVHAGKPGAGGDRVRPGDSGQGGHGDFADKTGGADSVRGGQQDFAGGKGNLKGDRLVHAGKQGAGRNRRFAGRRQGADRGRPEEKGLAGHGAEGDWLPSIVKGMAWRDDIHAPALNTPSKASRKKPPPPQPDSVMKRERGWMAGVGLNQFFPISGQRTSFYNPNGLTGTLTDYLPVPMIRYYFNSRLYVQLEAQFNTPQPTKKNLVISAPPVDTNITNPANNGLFIQHSASIRQLYYLNLPLSVHYTLFDNLNIGAGLQFSHLSNAIGEFDSKSWVPYVGATDTIKNKMIATLKGDTLYSRIRTNEFRFLLDLNYSYKQFIFGLRYNQSLTPFINLQLAPGQNVDGRNSSLQLYLRYILWDGRKKKKVPPTK